MNRSKLRENIFKLLYTAEFQEKEEMPQQMSLYFTYLTTMTRMKK